MNNQKKSYIFALTAIMMWGTVATAFKIALINLNFIQLLFISSTVASICLFIILLIQNKSKLVFTTSPKKILYFAILGLINPFIYYLLLFKAYSLITAQEALTLNYIWPISLLILSAIILKQKIKKLSYLIISLSFVGIIVIASKGSLQNLAPSNLFGDSLAIFSSIIWATYWILNLKFKNDNTLQLFYSFLFGSIYTFILCIITDAPFTYELKSFGAAIYVGLFEMGITFLFWMMALKNANNTQKISQLIFISPCISIFLVSFILKEPIYISTIIGFIIILTSIYLQQKFVKEE